MICGSTSRSTIVQLLPPSVCALATSSGGISIDAVGDVAHHHRRDADGDQRDLRRFAESERDEQDRQQRQRRDDADDGDEGRAAKPRTRGMKPMAMPSDERDERRRADAGEQPERGWRRCRPTG